MRYWKQTWLFVVIVLGIFLGHYIGVIRKERYHQKRIEQEECAIKIDETLELLNSIAYRHPPYEHPKSITRLYDAWGVPIRIQTDEDSPWNPVEVTSAGPDMTFKTDDDLYILNVGDPRILDPE